VAIFTIGLLDVWLAVEKCQSIKGWRRDDRDRLLVVSRTALDAANRQDQIEFDSILAE
jgi:hypothetical protein